MLGIFKAVKVVLYDMVMAGKFSKLIGHTIQRMNEERIWTVHNIIP
jgi:hypothetical protein